MTTETSLAFVERMERMLPVDIPPHQLQAEQDARRLLKLAKTAALIEEHGLSIGQPDEDGYWCAYDTNNDDLQTNDKSFHTAVRAVADKIKEQKA